MCVKVILLFLRNRFPLSCRQSRRGLGVGWWVGVGGWNSDSASVKYLELVIIFKEASRNFKSTFQDSEDETKI
jgi:hypothetical protein